MMMIMMMVMMTMMTVMIVVVIPQTEVFLIERVWLDGWSAVRELRARRFEWVERG